MRKGFFFLSFFPNNVFALCVLFPPRPTTESAALCRAAWRRWRGACVAAQQAQLIEARADRAFRARQLWRGWLALARCVLRARAEARAGAFFFARVRVRCVRSAVQVRSGPLWCFRHRIFLL